MVGHQANRSVSKGQVLAFFSLEHNKGYILLLEMDRGMHLCLPGYPLLARLQKQKGRIRLDCSIL